MLSRRPDAFCECAQAALKLTFRHAAIMILIHFAIGTLGAVITTGGGGTGDRPGSNAGDSSSGQSKVGRVPTINHSAIFSSSDQFLRRINLFTERLSPPKGRSSNLRLEFKLYHIVDVDDTSQVMELKCKMAYSWHDPRVEYTMRRLGVDSVEKVRLYGSQEGYLWRPVMRIQQNLGVPQEFGLENTDLYPDGRVELKQYLLLRLTCSMSVKDFPFDVQKCDLTFACVTCYPTKRNESFMGFYDNHDLAAFLDSTYETLGGQHNNKFELLKLEARLENGRAIVTITAKRRCAYYLFYLMGPGLIITCVAILQFMLPPDTGEKVSVGVTCLLSMTVFMIVLQQNLAPDTNSSIPLLAQYFGGLVLTIMITTAMSSIIIHIHYKGNDQSSRYPPKWLVYTTTVIAQMLNMRSCVDQIELCVDHLKRGRTKLSGKADTKSTTEAHSRQNLRLCSRFKRLFSKNGSGCGVGGLQPAVISCNETVERNGCEIPLLKNSTQNSSSTSKTDRTGNGATSSPARGSGSGGVVAGVGENSSVNSPYDSTVSAVLNEKQSKKQASVDEMAPMSVLVSQPSAGEQWMCHAVVPCTQTGAERRRIFQNSGGATRNFVPRASTNASLCQCSCEADDESCIWQPQNSMGNSADQHATAVDHVVGEDSIFFSRNVYKSTTDNVAEKFISTESPLPNTDCNAVPLNEGSVNGEDALDNISCVECQLDQVKRRMWRLIAKVLNAFFFILVSSVLVLITGLLIVVPAYQSMSVEQDESLAHSH